MIVHNLHFHRTLIGPNKTDAILIIDPYAMLPLSISSECLKTVSGRDTKLLKRT